MSGIGDWDPDIVRELQNMILHAVKNNPFRYEQEPLKESARHTDNITTNGNDERNPQ